MKIPEAVIVSGLTCGTILAHLVVTNPNAVNKMAKISPFISTLKIPSNAKKENMIIEPISTVFRLKNSFKKSFENVSDKFICTPLFFNNINKHK